MSLSDSVALLIHRDPESRALGGRDEAEEVGEVCEEAVVHTPLRDIANTDSEKDVSTFGYPSPETRRGRIRSQ